MVFLLAIPDHMHYGSDDYTLGSITEKSVGCRFGTSRKYRYLLFDRFSIPSFHWFIHNTPIPISSGIPKQQQSDAMVAVNFIFMG